MENPSIGANIEQGGIDLPAGFRFHPTDEELVCYYLSSKALDANFSANAIGEADFNKCEPWDLPKVAKMGGNEWYFFSLKDRKYPTGMRTNRATNAGYWKATGKDKQIYSAKILVGMKKTLVFYQGRAPRGEKTNWIMHEYRLATSTTPQNPSNNEWVVCRIFHKKSGEKKSPFAALNDASSSYIDPTTLSGVSSSTVPSFTTLYSDPNPIPNPCYYYPGNETGYPFFLPEPFNLHPPNYPFKGSMSHDKGFSSELKPDGSSGVSGYDPGLDPFADQVGPSGSNGQDDIDSFWNP